MMRAIVIALTLVASIGATAGSALADNGNGNGNNHNVCVVFSPDQKYNNTTYYCVSTPDLPPV
jgi:hypothetical protein